MTMQALHANALPGSLPGQARGIACTQTPVQLEHHKRRQTGQIRRNVVAQANRGSDASANGRRPRRQRRDFMDNWDNENGAEQDVATPHPNGATSQSSSAQPAESSAQPNRQQQSYGAASAAASMRQPSAASREGNGAQPSAADNQWDDWGWGDAGAAGGRPRSDNSASGTDRRTAPRGGANGNRAAAQDDYESWAGPDGEPPDITTLTVAERDAMLRITPFAEQVEFFKADPAQSVQRWAIASIVTLLTLTKAMLIAAGAVSSPLWWPWLQAANRNRELLAKYRHAGLWRAKVLNLEVQGRRMPRFTEPGAGARAPRQAFQPFLQLLAGDGSGATTQLSVPYKAEYNDIQVGDSIELLVVSTSPSFADFKALREGYLPEASLWIADYPHVDRDKFLDLSLAVERDRASAAADAASPTAQPYYGTASGM